MTPEQQQQIRARAVAADKTADGLPEYPETLPALVSLVDTLCNSDVPALLDALDAAQGENARLAETNARLREALGATPERAAGVESNGAGRV